MFGEVGLWLGEECFGGGCDGIFKVWGGCDWVGLEFFFCLGIGYGVSVFVFVEFIVDDVVELELYILFFLFIYLGMWNCYR